jgi:hypothetical protein
MERGSGCDGAGDHDEGRHGNEADPEGAEKVEVGHENTLGNSSIDVLGTSDVNIYEIISRRARSI